MADVRVSLPAPCRQLWEEMPSRGADRYCTACDTVVVDLQRLSPAELEARMAGPEKLCVRARINAKGEVQMRSERSSARKVVATVGAGIALLSGHLPASATPSGPTGSIAGTVQAAESETVAIATAADGRRYKAKVKPNWTFKIKHLPPGRYAMTFESQCGNGGWTGETVIVEPGATVKTSTKQTEWCEIIVGVIERPDQHG